MDMQQAPKQKVSTHLPDASSADFSGRCWRRSQLNVMMSSKAARAAVAGFSRRRARDSELRQA